MSISLIIPCYNEELNIQKGVLDRYVNYLADDSRFKEILIVDDGSTDDSRKIIKQKYLRKFPKLRLIENPHQGKAYAVMTGIREARSDYVIFSDMDLATPIDEADKIIAEFSLGSDIVIGTRSSRRDGAPLLRQVQSKGLVLVRDLILNLGRIEDTQCGFKGFKRTVALDIIDRLKVFVPDRHVEGPSVAAGFDIEFLFIAKKRGYKIAQVPVIWKHVETKRVNFWKDSIETLQDLLRIKRYDMMGKYAKK